MKLMRSVWRFLRLLVHIIAGIAVTVYTSVMRMPHDAPRYQRLSRWWLAGVLRILGGRVTVTGTPVEGGALMVCNHVSWLDIPLLGSESPVRFLAKKEIESWPVVGWLATKAGTLYIERGRRGAAQEAADNISESLRQGDVVLVFPEGTTSNGKDVLPFHARLFSSAIETGVDIQPVAICYRDASGAMSEKVPYVDDMSLWDNLMDILPSPHIDIEIHYLPPIKISGQDRKELASLSERQIRQALLSRK